jgi:hypothetical protein
MGVRFARSASGGVPATSPGRAGMPSRTSVRSPAPVESRVTLLPKTGSTPWASSGGGSATEGSAVVLRYQPTVAGPGRRGGKRPGVSAVVPAPPPDDKIGVRPPPGDRHGPQGGVASSSGGAGSPSSPLIFTAFALIVASCAWYIARASMRFMDPEARWLERPG